MIERPFLRHRDHNIALDAAKLAVAEIKKGEAVDLYRLVHSSDEGRFPAPIATALGPPDAEWINETKNKMLEIERRLHQKLRQVRSRLQFCYSCKLQSPHRCQGDALQSRRRISQT